MNSREPSLATRYREVLSQYAQRIVGNNPTVPVDLEQICAQYSLQLLHKDISGYRAYLATSELEDEARYFILLPRKGKGTSFERFCIAHEIAHYLLLTQFGTPNPAELNHWRTESLCDEFARQLLVPDGFLRTKLPNPASTASDMLRAADRVAVAAGVPWIQAARRVHEVATSARFLRMQIEPDKRLKVISTALPGNKETGRLIASDSAWTMEIQRTLSESKNGVRSLDHVDAVMISSSRIPSIARASDVAIRVDSRRPIPDIRVAAIV